MSKRWLSGFLIFALGFGSASLVTIATAQDVPEEGELEEGLDYVNAPDKFKLVNSGDRAYVVMVTRRSGVPAAEPQVSYTSDVITISKNGLDTLTVYRIVPVTQLDGVLRPCDEAFWDCPWRSPIPPPPPPTVTFSIPD
jgi:hypothetical protein